MMRGKGPASAMTERPSSVTAVTILRFSILCPFCCDDGRLHTIATDVVLRSGRVDQVRTRTGGRSARVRQRVLAAVRHALESGDTDGLTIERLADKAGVHRATIYRRWLSSAGLVADLLASLTPLEPELPDTGDLRSDLLAVARRVADTVDTPFARSTLQLAAASDDPELTTAASDYWSKLLDHTAKIIRRAQQRGDAATDIDPVAAIESLLGPIHMRTLVTRQPLTRTDIEHLAHRTARMLRP